MGEKEGGRRRREGGREGREGGGGRVCVSEEGMEGGEEIHIETPLCLGIRMLQV